MEAIQVERWKFFTKAACYGFRPEATEARKQKLWAEAETFIDDYADEPVDGWDNSYCLCDCFSERFFDYEWDITMDRHNWAWLKEDFRYFANHLRAAIRSGLNAALAADGLSVSTAVIGYTVDDLREMLGGELPEWFACQYPDCLQSAAGNSSIAL